MCWTELGAAQQTSGRDTIVVLDLAFNGWYANSLEAGDSLLSQVATRRLVSALAESERFTIIDPGRVEAAVAATEDRGILCGLDCARAVGEQFAARWVVRGKVTKTSNLIWYLTGQLLQVSSGKLLLDDGYELKGPSQTMVPAGARHLAEQITRAVGEASHAEATASADRWQLTLNSGAILYGLRIVGLSSDSLVVRHADTAATIPLGQIVELRLVQKSSKQIGAGERGALGGLVGADDKVYEMTLLSLDERRGVIELILRVSPPQSARSP